MNELLYKMIFKRKSFHIFKDILPISNEELLNIESLFKELKPLYNDIKYDIRITPSSETNCKRGGEYCILFYSEKKGNYLQNIGYIGEQLDLYLSSMNIGALWYGIGTIKEKKYNNLDFVIMINISKKEESEFRKDMYKSKRKQLEEIWSSTSYIDIANIVRFAPSACNTQPWLVEGDGKAINIYRYKQPGKRGIMPVKKVNYYNKIDLGIFLSFLDICLKHNSISYTRDLFLDTTEEDIEKVLFATYKFI